MTTPIFPLFVGPCWGSDRSNVVTVNKMLVDDINYLAQATSTEIPIGCIIQKKQSEITVEDLEDSKQRNISAIYGSKLPRGKSGSVSADCLDINTASYYGHNKDQWSVVTHIIGHIPEYSNAAFNIKESILSRSLSDLSPRIILVIHEVPKDSEGKVSDDLSELLKDCSLVLSLGKSVYFEIENILGNDGEGKHVLYLPSPPVDLLAIPRQEPRDNLVQGPQNILLYSHCLQNVDFKLSVSSVLVASDVMQQRATELDHLRVTFNALHEDSEGKDGYKNKFEEIKKEIDVRHKKTNFTQDASLSKEKITNTLKKSKLCIFPASNDSTLLGMEPLMAAYSGLPVLVSGDCGAGGIFRTLYLDESIVSSTGDFKQDLDAWSTEIVNKLKDPKAAYEETMRVRRQCLLDAATPASHLRFLVTLTEESSVELPLDMDVIKDLLKERNAENIPDMGIAGLQDVEDVHERIYQFMLYLLQQRDKIAANLLNSEFPANLLSTWNALFEVVEGQNRRVMAVNKGSLVLTVFCPTDEANSGLLETFLSSDATIQSRATDLWKEMVSCILDEDFELPWGMGLEEAELDIEAGAEVFVAALLDRQSGLIPGSEFAYHYIEEPDSVFPTRNAQLLANYLGLDISFVIYHLIEGLICCIGVEGLEGLEGLDELNWNETAFEIFKEAEKILPSKFETDKSHFLYGGSIGGEWIQVPLLKIETLRQILQQLMPEAMPVAALEKMITLCARDPNWDYESKLQDDPVLRMLISSAGREKLFLEISEILVPLGSDAVLKALQNAITAQDGTDYRWSKLSCRAIENLCREVRFLLGGRMAAELRITHKDDIEEKRMSYGKPNIAELFITFFIDSICDFLASILTGSELQNVANNIGKDVNQAHNEDLKYKFLEVMLKTISCFAISNLVLFVDAEDEAIDSSEQLDVDKQVWMQYLVTKLQSVVARKLTEEQESAPNTENDHSIPELEEAKPNIPEETFEDKEQSFPPPPVVTRDFPNWSDVIAKLTTKGWKSFPFLGLLKKFESFQQLGDIFEYYTGLTA